MKQYLALLSKIRNEGEFKGDRTGTGTLSIFGEQMKFDLSKSFPIITTKEINHRAIFNEYCWMVCRGSVDVSWLQKRGHKFWDEWQKIDGTIGPGYGKQFRAWRTERDIYGDEITFDQVKELIAGIRKNPDSRRHIISLWNVADIPDMALPPCHGLVTQFYVNKGRLDCATYQRSADAFLGLPWNISFYALFTYVVAALAKLRPGTLTYNLGDVHIYQNHISQVDEQLRRIPLAQPQLKINLPALEHWEQHVPIDRLDIENFELTGYQHHPAIRAKVAV